MAKCRVNRVLLWKLGGGWAVMEGSGCEAGEVLQAELLCQCPSAQRFNFQSPTVSAENQLVEAFRGLVHECQVLLVWIA